MQDDDAYIKYPQHHNWFNKLWVAEKLGHYCGPCGLAPDRDGVYVVRPIYNLSGMGVGATVKEIKVGDTTQVPAGYFWCEYFDGPHYSADYKWEYDRDHIMGEWKEPWKGQSCYEGVNMPINLSKFYEWKRSDYIPHVPDELVELRDVGHINVEFIGDKVIDVHLRESPDPKYDHIVPVWASDLVYEGWPGAKKQMYEKHNYQFIEDYDNADGQLADPRIGFFVK